MNNYYKKVLLFGKKLTNTKNLIFKGSQNERGLPKEHLSYENINKFDKKEFVKMIIKKHEIYNN